MRVLIVQRAEAQAAGMKRYFTGMPCSRGHVAERQTSNKSCMVCMAQRPRSEDTRQKDAERKAAWHAAHRDRELVRRRQHYVANADRYQAFGQAYRATRKLEQATRRRRHYEANASAYKANARARHEHVKRATPPWADLEAIKAFYAEAAERTKSTGVPHEVDHEIPLRGKLVCGLHVTNNLRVITAVENGEKKNKWEPTCDC